MNGPGPSQDYEQRPSVLVATLGTQPEVVTIALDLLLDDEVNIEQVHVIHTASLQLGDRMDESLRSLRREFPGGTHYQYRGQEVRRCGLTLVQLRAGGRALDDVRTEEDARATLDTLFNVVRELKMQRYLIHLSIAGGRKSMSVYGMATAQLLFDSQDCLWHVFSRSSFESQSLMHPTRADDANLVGIPVLPISSVFPGMVTLLSSREPLRVLERKQLMMRLEEQRSRQEFLEQWLTPAEEQLVTELMKDIVVENRALSNSELARKLVLAPRTVANRFTDIYAKLCDYLKLSPEEEKVDRTILVSFLTPYYRERF